MTDRPRSWEEMRTQIAELLQRRTGEGVDAWNRRVASSGADDETVLRAWLTGKGVTGYPQMLLVMERFGYPDYLLAQADELIDCQYADRPQLRPILDAVLAVASTFGEVSVQARKTYVSLVGPRRTFAAVRGGDGRPQAPDRPQLARGPRRGGDRLVPAGLRRQPVRADHPAPRLGPMRPFGLGFVLALDE